MIVCVNCKQEMTCKKTGYGVRWHKDHYYPGDLFICKNCGNEVIVTNNVPIVNSKSPGLSMTKNKEQND